MGSDDPVRRNPVLPSGEDSNGGQQLLVRDVNVLVDNGSIKIVTIKTLDSG